MNGITFEEFYEYMEHWHEAEFLYKEMTYVLQPEVYQKKTYLVIWKVSSEPRCISRHPIPEIGAIPRSDILAVLNDKCFDGKSFLEIEKDVTIETIF